MLMGKILGSWIVGMTFTSIVLSNGLCRRIIALSAKWQAWMFEIVNFKPPFQIRDCVASYGNLSLPMDHCSYYLCWYYFIRQLSITALSKSLRWLSALCFYYYLKKYIFVSISQMSVSGWGDKVWYSPDRGSCYWHSIFRSQFQYHELLVHVCRKQQFCRFVTGLTIYSWKPQYWRLENADSILIILWIWDVKFVMTNFHVKTAFGS